MILNHLFEVYLLVFVSVVIHELVHYIVGKMIKLRIESVHIGDDFFAIHIRKLYISFMIFSGSYVQFYVDELKNKTMMQKIFFFISGPLANLFLICVAVLLRKINIMYMDMLLWINIYFFFGNVFPFFFKENDIGKLKYYIKQNTFD